MTQKELEQKVIDAEGRVAKREAVLKKHNSQLAKMIEKGADRFDISIKREDIKSATSKLAEARETLANWQDKLNTRITRDAYLEANTPEILKDFLENWKQHAIGYYREKRIRFIEYRKDLKAKERAARLEALQTLPSLEKYRELYKGRELTDYDLANLWPRRDVDAFLSERGLEYHQIQKKLREAGDQITLKLLEIHNEDEREAWLEKTMEEEKRAKLLDLIGRIMSTVGTITDAVGQTLAEREAGSFGSLAALLEGVPALRDFAIVREAVVAAFVVPADPGGDLVDGHVLTEVAAVVAVDDDGVRVCLQDPDGVVEVVGLPLAVPDVAPDRQGVPRAAGAIHDCPADAVADLRGEVSGDVSQCCHAGASSLVMCTTVTRSSISCLVVYVSRSSSPMCRSSVSGPSSRKAVTATAFSR